MQTKTAAFREAIQQIVDEDPDMDMPTYLEKARQQQRTPPPKRYPAEPPNFEPPQGTDDYEDRFKFYWLATAWAVLSFNGCLMVIAALHMAWPSVIGYSAVIHALTAAVVTGTVAGLALIYRLVLFPTGPVWFEPREYSHENVGGSGGFSYSPSDQAAS